MLRATDAGGTTAYKYGKLGETTEETRTIRRRRLAREGTLTATTGYLPNYLGQMEKVTYPDGETVAYGYDAGGQVTSVRGSHYGHQFLYVTDIGYDELGQRAYIEYGTGVRTEYEYDPDRRWLSGIGTAKGSVQYQNISYSFDRAGNVLGYVNDCAAGGNYKTSQSYGYDDLYQLTRATGTTSYTPYKGVKPVHTSTYTQEFSFDVLGNMTRKGSTNAVEPSQVKIGDDLNYSLSYSYAAGFAHRLDHVGERYYKYDENGNIILEGGEAAAAGASAGGTGSGSGGNDDWVWDDDDVGGGIGSGSLSAGGAAAVSLSGDDDDWDWDDEDEGGGIGGGPLAGYGTGGMGGGSPAVGGGNTTVIRTYEWDERNQMVRSTNGGTEAWYVYGADGRRTNKYTAGGETVYFSQLWTWREDDSFDAQTAKSIYLGETRLVTKLNSGDGHDSYSEELHKTYYWHPDHLGSAQLITDWQGNEYQRIEYTPYGETWAEKTEATYEWLPYRFTGKELDSETGLYYYGARYLAPKFSIWTSTDPALGDYLPTAGADNSSLPGMGGVFNTTNCHLYHYAGNNPVRYVDPDGKYEIFAEDGQAYILIEDNDSLWNVVRGQSPYTTDAEVIKRIQDIEKENNLKNSNFIYPGDKLKAPNSVVPDITEDLMEKMKKNASDPMIHNPFYFRNRVKSGGEWDFKTNKDSIYQSNPLQYYNYIFLGDIVRYDAPGNIHYGYVGKAAFWSFDWLLFKGAGVAQKTDNPDAGWKDDDTYDAKCIQMGIDLYKKNHK